MSRWSWIRGTESNEDGERFVIGRSARSRSGWVNYWHLKDGHVYLFTFLPNQKYNKRKHWDRELYLKLEEDLRSAKPSVEVMRFAVDDKVIFYAKGSGFAVPAMPAPPRKSPDWERHLEKLAQRENAESLQGTQQWGEPQMTFEQRAEREEKKGKEKAPYILHGKFSEDSKEFSWKLTPDKPKRQGIQPGDRVLVWTKKGFAKVTCTRIERVDMRRKQPEHPKYRVKKKL